MYGRHLFTVLFPSSIPLAGFKFNSINILYNCTVLPTNLVTTSDQQTD